MQRDGARLTTLDNATLNALSLALGLGLLIGLQRERARARLGGIRTFPLVALFGAVCGLLTREWGAPIAAAGLLGIAALLVIANIEKRRTGDETAGQTTEVAALLTYALGALLATGQYEAALVAGGVTAVLLYFKEPMHEFAGGMSENDVRAVMRLVIISLIILPVLPDREYGPYAVLNPREIWLMVVLIVGIGLIGYVSYKLFRGNAGAVINGILGGLISSTATTVAYARRVRDTGAVLTAAALIIGIAWTISVARVIVEVMVVAPTLVPRVVPPLAALLAVMIAACGVMWLAGKGKSEEMPSQHNPAELAGALIFGAIYAVVIFASAAVRHHFGEQAVYAVAVVSGVVDVDAITLSTARLGAAGRLEPATVWKIIMLACLSNVVFKGAAVLVLGSTALFVRLLPICALTVGAGAALIFAWSV